MIKLMALNLLTFLLATVVFAQVYDSHPENKGKAKIGNVNSSHLDINSQGRVTAIGDSAYWWREIFVKPTGVYRNPTSTKPDLVSFLTVGQSFSFDATTPESLFFLVEIPHDHVTGTHLDCHFHWLPTTTNNGTVRFKAAWMVQDINDTFAFAAGDTISAQQAGDGTAYKHQYLNLGEIPMTGVSGVSSVLYGVLLRDAGSDTGTFEAIYGDLGFHYQCNELGSRWENAK